MPRCAAAYLKHYTFVWSTLAAEVASKRDTGRHAANRDIVPRRIHPKTRTVVPPHSTQNKPAGSAAPKPGAPEQPPTTAPDSNLVPKLDAAQKPMEQNKNNTAAAGSGSGTAVHTASSGTAVHTAAVTSPDFLLPTAPESSGEAYTTHSHGP